MQKLPQPGLVLAYIRINLTVCAFEVSIAHQRWAAVAPLTDLLPAARLYTGASPDPKPPFATVRKTISQPLARHNAVAQVVKLFHANERFMMLISPEGHILTVFSYVLDTDYITVVLSDGRKFEAKLLGADPHLEIAVLKIGATDLPYFDLPKAATGRMAENVLAFSNLFNVAIMPLCNFSRPSGCSIEYWMRDITSSP